MDGFGGSLVPYTVRGTDRTRRDGRGRVFDTRFLYTIRRIHVSHGRAVGVRFATDDVRQRVVDAGKYPCTAATAAAAAAHRVAAVDQVGKWANPPWPLVVVRTAAFTVLAIGGIGVIARGHDGALAPGTDEWTGIGGDLPRARDFHGGPAYKLKKKSLRNVLKNLGPPSIYDLETYT